MIRPLKKHLVRNYNYPDERKKRMIEMTYSVLNIFDLLLIDILDPISGDQMSAYKSLYDEKIYLLDINIYHSKQQRIYLSNIKIRGDPIKGVKTKIDIRSDNLYNVEVVYENLLPQRIKDIGSLIDQILLPISAFRTDNHYFGLTHKLYGNRFNIKKQIDNKYFTQTIRNISFVDDLIETICKKYYLLKK